MFYLRACEQWRLIVWKNVITIKDKSEKKQTRIALPLTFVVHVCGSGNDDLSGGRASIIKQGKKFVSFLRSNQISFPGRSKALVAQQCTQYNMWPLCVCLESYNNNTSYHIFYYERLLQLTNICKRVTTVYVLYYYHMSYDF